MRTNRLISYLGSFKQSKVTRIFYVGIIFLVISAGMLMITPQLTGRLQEIFCHNSNYYICDLLIGYDAVYRLSFALAIWFIILAFATLGINSSNDKRAKIQNSCWATKLLGLILLEFLFLLIPHTDYNGEVWMFFGLNGAFCFIILQYTFILDAANSFNVFSEVISRNDNKEFSNVAVSWFHVAKTFTTTCLYAISLLSSISFYFMYTAYPECMDNFVFLLFHLIMCFSASVIAILPIVREVSPQSGLFQCSVTSLYCTYLIWLAFSSEPDRRCNPWDFHRYPSPPTSNVQVYVTLFITFGTLIFTSLRDVAAPQFGKVCKDLVKPLPAKNLDNDSDRIPKETLEDNYRKPQSSILENNEDETFHSYVLDDQEKQTFTGKNPFAPCSDTSQGSSKDLSPMINVSIEKEREGKSQENQGLVWDDERSGIEYSYSFFHLTFCLATVYLMMSITNWYRLDEGEHLTVRLIQSWSAVWLRISASIFCSFIFIWSMIVPLVFPDSHRDLLFFQYMTSLSKS